MKNFKILTLVALCLFTADLANAQNTTLQREIDVLREDIQVIQRKVYRESQDGISPASAQDVAVRMGQFDEILRKAVGKMDEMGHKIKSLNEKIDLMNKDIDFRLSALEGKPVSRSNHDAHNNINKKKFDAPVASKAPKSLVGGSITKSDNLAPVKTASVNELYQQGLDAIKASNNDLAIQRFNSILLKFPKDKLAGNAQYWMGEAYYAKKDFSKAAVTFAKGYEKYKDGTKGADNILKLGMSMAELGKTKEACTAFLSLPKTFPKASEELKVKAGARASALKCK